MLQSLQLGAGLSQLLETGLLFESQLGPLVGQRLAFDGQDVELFLVQPLHAGDGLVFLLQLGDLVRQVGTPFVLLLLQILVAPRRVAWPVPRARRTSSDIPATGW